MPNPTASKAGERPLQRQAPGASRDAAEVTAPASPWAGVLFLQRAAGNRAVSSILERRPRDAGSPTGAVLRRKCKECDEEDKEKEGHVIRRSAAPGAAASGSGSGDEGGQDQPSGDAGGSAPSTLRSYLSRSMSGGMALDASVRAPLESSFGHDFNQVRIHADAAAARAAESVDAHAFTLGNSIWFGRGQYRPDTPTGRYLLAHELAHTIQQRGQAPGLQRQLVIGSTTDPAEASADRAALAVTYGGVVPSVGSSTSIVRRRKVTGSAHVPGNVNQRLVTLDDGKRYRVTRHRRLVPTTRTQGTPTRVRPGADKDNVWIQIEWCKGETQGQIRLRADIPAQTQELLKKILNVIQSGGNGNDLLKELQGAEITPSATFDITQSKTWQLVGSIKMTVSRGGPKSAGAKVEVKTPGGTFGVEAEGGSSGGSVIGTFSRPLPGEPKAVKCNVEKTELKVESTFTCELETITPPSKVKKFRDVPKTLERSRYIYFHFELDRIEEGRTAPELAALQADIADDFKVAQIEGFTSPEGPMAKRGRFRGNTKLAQDRAEAAFKRVQKTCSTASGCFVGEDDATRRTVGGDRGELYTKVTPLGEEAVGRDLAEHAVGEFATVPSPGSPDPEKRHREDPKIAAELERRRTPESKAEVVYPLLRRAVVTLNKTVIEKEPYFEDVPGKNEFQSAACPEEVLDQARSDFTREDT